MTGFTECGQCHQDITGTKHVCPGPLYRVFVVALGYRLSTGEPLLKENEKTELVRYLEAHGIAWGVEHFIGDGCFMAERR